MVGSPDMSGGYPSIESKMLVVAVGRSIGIAAGFENDLPVCLIVAVPWTYGACRSPALLI